MNRRMLALVVSAVIGFVGYPLAAQQAPLRSPKTAATAPAVPEATLPQAARALAADPNFVPQAPDWLPLPADHKDYLDKVLKYWEHRSGQIQRYQAEFLRWEYDPVFGPKDPNVCKSFSKGTLRFATPDKGMFRVDTMKVYVAPKKAEEKPSYEERVSTDGEHWICNGKSIFQFDSQKKQVIETVLPPDMQGTAIVDGPLPFLFGAKADKIRERYWMRVITPKDVKGEYWLEAIPKTQQDAANFKMVHIMLDEKEFLPLGLVIFPLNYNPPTSPARTTLRFEKREVNGSDLANKLNPLYREFYEVKVPSGWEKIVQQYDTPPAAQANRPRPPEVKSKQA